jgi:nucleoside 2-deoxyribosyltransferase
MKPRIYLAGKIAKNDWRHKLVPQLRGTEWPGAPIECESFVYCGPFFAGCDHGCAHGPTRHGVVSDSPCQDDQQTMTDEQIRDLVIATNTNALGIADVVFAYVDCMTAYGTLVELGAAYAMGKQVVLMFGSNLQPDDRSELWYAHRQADVVHESIEADDVARIVVSTCWHMVNASAMIGRRFKAGDASW